MNVGTTAVLASGQTCTTCGTCTMCGAMSALKELPAAFYATPPGNEPVREWLFDLDEGSRRAVGQDIATVGHGWPVGMRLCRHPGGGLLEVRSDITGGRIARVIFVIHEDRRVLLHGFVKKAPKTPKPALDLARKRAKGVTS